MSNANSALASLTATYTDSEEEKNDESPNSDRSAQSIVVSYITIYV